MAVTGFPVESYEDQRFDQEDKYNIYYIKLYT